MSNPHKIWFVFFDGYQVLDLAGPLAAISSVNELFPVKTHYEIKLIGGQSGLVSSSSAHRILADAAWHEVLNEDVDTLIAVGGDNVGNFGSDPAVVGFLTLAGGRAKRVCSICTGAFLLGAAGFLEGKRVATHWSAVDELRQRFPTTTVEPDAIYAVDGKVWTSAGVTSGIDMMLALIEADHGHEVAVAVARRLVVYMIRPGGQAQFSIHLTDVRKRSDSISQMLSEIEASLGAPLSVASLAARTGMSIRNFCRRFKDEVGQSPTNFITSRRLARAQTLLENSDLPLKSIAREIGFASDIAFRRAFANQFSVSPNEYRSRFGSRRIRVTSR
ncbi:helix-turn-helix domain-containing protein [Agrobacterium vitis]|uniref:Helix-turn-helix domain-containing protein n=2 Tax=Agrobacterium vitis TaxID=373 RepID=A0A6L6VM84_AGRVI|nr:GlxA family transcriptional regulator [Agrobacterium vitis]MUZ75845.1 helix-turn-helix domain-containing protein [Agrobacterium vitis]